MKNEVFGTIAAHFSISSIAGINAARNRRGHKMSLNGSTVDVREECASKSLVAPHVVELLRNWVRTRDRLQRKLSRTPKACELMACEELALKQLAIFRKVLEASAKNPRELSYHSVGVTLT